MAQNQDNQNNPVSNISSLKFGGEVPGFFSSPPGVNLLRNAIANPDGSKTIKAGQQVPEANELNQKYCESFGAKDITNEADLTIGSDTLYAAVCIGSVGRHPSNKVQVIPGAGTGRIFIPIPGGNLQLESSSNLSTRAGLQINAYATNGSSPFNQTYYANAYADFFNMPSTNQASGVGTVNENGPCSWTRTLALGPGNGTISGFAACTPSKSQATSSMTACFAGTCVVDRRLVTHY